MCPAVRLLWTGWQGRAWDVATRGLYEAARGGGPGRPSTARLRRRRGSARDERRRSRHGVDFRRVLLTPAAVARRVSRGGGAPFVTLHVTAFGVGGGFAFHRMIRGGLPPRLAGQSDGARLRGGLRSVGSRAWRIACFVSARARGCFRGIPSGFVPWLLSTPRPRRRRRRRGARFAATGHPCFRDRFRTRFRCLVQDSGPRLLLAFRERSLAMGPGRVLESGPHYGLPARTLCGNGFQGLFFMVF